MIVQEKSDLANYRRNTKLFFHNLVEMSYEVFEEWNTYTFNTEKDLDEFKYFINVMIRNENSVFNRLNSELKGLDMEEQYIIYKNYHSLFVSLFAKSVYELSKVDIDNIIKKLI